MTEQSLQKTTELLNKTIEALSSNDFETAKQHLHNGINESDCSICQLEMQILEADTEHAEKMCMLDADICKEESEALIDKAKELKKYFEEAKEY